MRYLFTWLGLIGCSGKSPPPCQEWTLDEASVGPLLTLNRYDEPSVNLQAVFPNAPRTDEGAPTAIFIHGGWSPLQIPLESDSVKLRADMGFTTLYPNLGRTDARGEASRSILATVIAYANGEISDTQDCSLDDRIPSGRAPEIALAGFSNGGNLAWATAADDSLAIERLDGIATFETPPSSQLILGESGTQRQQNERFDVDACALEVNLSIHCDIDYRPLQSLPADECSSETGCLFIDIDASNGWSEGDFQLGRILDPNTDNLVYSLAATRVAEELGILPDDAYDSIDANAFWSTREATRNMNKAVEQFPTIAGIATGTRVDHVLDDLPRPVHVLGMVQAMKESGVPWFRLHPDASYLDEIHGSTAAWQDIPPNENIRIQDTEWSMEPEDNATIRGTDYLSAAIAEILDRSRTVDWSNDP